MPSPEGHSNQPNKHNHYTWQFMRTAERPKLNTEVTEYSEQIVIMQSYPKRDIVSVASGARNHMQRQYCSES